MTNDYHSYQLIAAEAENQFGFIFQIPWLPSPSDGPCLHIALWATNTEPELINACEEIINEAIRSLMHKNALQGFMASWDWIPHDSSWATPYEFACGERNKVAFVGNATQYRNYLSAIGSKVWLGAELLARIGGMAALKPIKGVTYCKPYAEIVLSSDAAIDQAEAILEPILPGTIGA